MNKEFDFCSYIFENPFLIMTRMIMLEKMISLMCNNNKKEEYFRAICNYQDRKIKLRIIN